MLALVRQRADLCHDQRLLKAIKGIGVKSTLALIASVPELGRIDNKAAAALIGVAPFVHKSGTMTAPAQIFGGRAAARHILYLYMAAISAGDTTGVAGYASIQSKRSLDEVSSRFAAYMSPDPISGFDIDPSY